MTTKEIIEIIIGCLGILTSVLALIKSVIDLKNSKKTTGNSKIQVTKIKGSHNTTTISLADNSTNNSNNITYNYNVFNQSYTVDNKKADIEHKDCDWITTFIIAIILLILFVRFHFLIFSFMVVLIMLYIGKNLYFFKEKGKKEKIFKLGIFLISILCCVFYWFPISAPEGYPDNIFNLVKGIKGEGTDKLLILVQSFTFAICQALGCIFLFFLHSIPYINFLIQKLKKKFKMNRILFFHLNDKKQLAFSFFALLLLSGLLNLLFLFIQQS